VIEEKKGEKRQEEIQLGEGAMDTSKERKKSKGAQDAKPRKEEG